MRESCLKLSNYVKTLFLFLFSEKKMKVVDDFSESSVYCDGWMFLRSERLLFLSEVIWPEDWNISLVIGQHKYTKLRLSMCFFFDCGTTSVQ